MIDWSQFPPHILPRLQAHKAMKSVRHQPQLFRDTSDFTHIDYGDVICIDETYFLVVGYTREGRFGIDDQPKQWVPKVVNLETGERNILKLVFYETFQLKLGNLTVTCYRSPDKEARVLDLVHGNDMFMQGYSSLDEGGNLVRVLDIIRGKRLDDYIGQLSLEYEEYMAGVLQTILKRFVEAIEGIVMLHEYGYKHGDIRRDHILIDAYTGKFRWIDFDYDFHLPERPFALDLIGLGNILLFILGRQNYRPVDVLEHPKMGEKVLETLHVNDLSLLSRDRIFNLKKIIPQVPKCFNDILCHFTVGTEVMYDSVAEFRDDVVAAITEVYGS